MPQECKFGEPFLYLPGKNRRRPALTLTIRKRIWRQSGYRCAIPLCRSPGVEIHHIVPWREALWRFREAHFENNLIPLCPACHAKADNEEITRSELEYIKKGLAAKIGGVQHDASVLFESLSMEDEGFLLHLRDWHRDFVYRGRSAQFQDYLRQLHRNLERNGELRTIKGVGVLAALGGVLRRQESRHFRVARRLLTTAYEITKDLKKTQWVGPEVGRIQYDLGYIAFLCNNYIESLFHYDQGMATDLRAKEIVGLRITESEKELVRARITGNYDPFKLRENLAIFSDIDNADACRWVTNCKIHLAQFCLAMNNPEAALEHLEAALCDYNRLGLLTGRAALLRLFGVAYLKLNELDQALRVLSASMVYYRQLGISQGFAEMCCTYGTSLELAGLASDAFQIYRLGVTADPGMDNQVGIRKCQSNIERLESP